MKSTRTMLRRVITRVIETGTVTGMYDRHHYTDLLNPQVNVELSLFKSRFRYCNDEPDLPPRPPNVLPGPLRDPRQDLLEFDDGALQ